MKILALAASTVALVACSSTTVKPVTSKPAAASSAATSSATVPAAATPPLVEGAPAPDFVMPASDGSKVALSSLRGRTVILYFYTRDETPTAIREATDFRDAWPELRQRGVAVVGVSTNDLSSQRAFATRLKLPFLLGSDPQGSTARAYGVPVEYGLAERQTFVIAPDGTVEKIYRSVDIQNHVASIVASLR